MTVESILAGGFGLLKRHPRAIACWAILYLLFAAASYLIVRPMLGPIMEMQQAMMAAQASGQDPAQVVVPAFPSGFVGALLFIYAGLALVSAMIFAAAVRTVASGEESALGNLRLGWDELRLIGLALIFIVGFSVAFTIIAILASIAIAALGAVSVALAVLVAIPTFIALFCATIYVEVRLSLAGAMTVLERRIVLTDAWRATKGRFWTLFAAYFILWLIMFVLYLVVITITTPWIFSGFTSPEAMQAEMQQQFAAQMEGLSVMQIIMWLVGAVVFTGLMAVFSGAVATAALSVDTNRSLASRFD